MYKNRPFAIRMLFVWLMLSSCLVMLPQTTTPVFTEYKDIVTGAEHLLASDLSQLKGRRIGIVANQSSRLDSEHLVDALLEKDINVVRIFSPEHGFRGEAEAGAKVSSGFDSQTGLQVVSLYGNNKKPAEADLEGIDLMLFDLQDVGARFYTYISTLTYVMEACAENGIPLIVLDRPNPNGFYVDGPILEPDFASFVGLHPVPIVYGMTIGEYARMVNGQQWLENGIQCDLNIIPLKNYQHKMIFELPVNPSPNLPNWMSVFLYPSLCLFEGTIMSVGRGTELPFQIYGHPDFSLGSFFFVPESRPGASLHPKHEGIGCYGQNLTGYAKALKEAQKNPVLRDLARVNLSWLLGSYELLSEKYEFFNDYFDKLAGTDQLRKQIIEGKSETEIREGWRDGVEQFMEIRSKYLIYN